MMGNTLTNLPNGCHLSVLVDEDERIIRHAVTCGEQKLFQTEQRYRKHLESSILIHPFVDSISDSGHTTLEVGKPVQLDLDNVHFIRFTIDGKAYELLKAKVSGSSPHFSSLQTRSSSGFIGGHLPMTVNSQYSQDPDNGDEKLLILKPFSCYAVLRTNQKSQEFSGGTLKDNGVLFFFEQNGTPTCSQSFIGKEYKPGFQSKVYVVFGMSRWLRPCCEALAKSLFNENGTFKELFPFLEKATIQIAHPGYQH